MNRQLFSALWGLASFALSVQASAQVDLGAFGRAMADPTRAQLAPSSARLPKFLARGRGGGVPLIAYAKGRAVSAPGLATLGDFAVGEVDGARLSELTQAHPDWVFDWAPPRHVLLDRIEGWVHAESVRTQTRTSGQGVVVGIIDTGVDLTHRDLRTSDGKTRVAWLLDVSRPPQNLHPELEAVYGCDIEPGCAIYSAADLDALTANAISGDEPSDPVGHGTHVASLAAGNGLASPTPRYIGVAPEASYIVARVAQASGGILDADVLRAARFVFDRAEELGMPAVVNLSLGSDFGGHDGSSGLELGLSSLVGPNFPGRAIVVAAGNSAGLYEDIGSGYPGPFGVHTEVHVPLSSVSRVPILTPAVSGNTVSGSAFVWIAFRPGDEVTVALEDKDETRIPAVPFGRGNKYEDGALTLTILNGPVSGASDEGVNPGQNGAIVVIDGKWAADRNFVLRFEGHGTVELWVQGDGDLSPDVGLGALFPRGEKEGTINVPASATGLIAVGATLNRTNWIDVIGNAINLPMMGALDNTPLDTIAYFSSAGPSALGVLKPDIVAPGVFVAGAMARSADPRRTSNGLFANSGRCPTEAECFVVDETHAITSGTSMSAPLVTGAIALLFQRDPTLTQDAARAILQAGARPLDGIVLDARQIGPGALDLEGALTVATAGDSPALRTPGSKSWLSTSASFAHPDPHWPLTCYVELRDEEGHIADGFDPKRLHLTAEPAQIHEGLTRVMPGFFRFVLTAPEGSGGGTLHLAVSYDDRVIVAKDLPIAVDRWLATDGVSARGGCNAGNSDAGGGTRLMIALAALLAGLGRRRYMRAKYAVHD